MANVNHLFYSIESKQIQATVGINVPNGSTVTAQIQSDDYAAIIKDYKLVSAQIVGVRRFSEHRSGKKTLGVLTNQEVHSAAEYIYDNIVGGKHENIYVYPDDKTVPEDSWSTVIIGEQDFSTEALIGKYFSDDAPPYFHKKSVDEKIVVEKRKWKIEDIEKNIGVKSESCIANSLKAYSLYKSETAGKIFPEDEDEEPKTSDKKTSLTFGDFTLLIGCSNGYDMVDHASFYLIVKVMGNTPEFIVLDSYTINAEHIRESIDPTIGNNASNLEDIARRSIIGKFQNSFFKFVKLYYTLRAETFQDAEDFAACILDLYNKNRNKARLDVDSEYVKELRLLRSCALWFPKIYTQSNPKTLPCTLLLDFFFNTQSHSIGKLIKKEEFIRALVRKNAYVVLLRLEDTFADSKKLATYLDGQKVAMKNIP